MEILLIVGSESGNAEMVADIVKERLEELGCGARLFQGGGIEEAALAETSLALVVSSTTGLGDVPQNLVAFYEALAEARPALDHLRYGVVGMGDRNYRETFCGGPKKLDARLAELGARRIGPPLLLDATDNPTPEEDASQWVEGFVAALCEEAPVSQRLSRGT